MAAEKIDTTLPSMKEKALEVLSEEYASREEGVQSIRENLAEFYRKELGDSYQGRAQSVEKSIEEIGLMYTKYFFPEMKARWDSFPDNIGHLISPGCFRCHDGEHASKEGKAITRDCTVCHSIIEQGPPGAVEKSTDGLEFKHPVDISEMWQEMNCYDCHTGGS